MQLYPPCLRFQGSGALANTPGMVTWIIGDLYQGRRHLPWRWQMDGTIPCRAVTGQKSVPNHVREPPARDKAPSSAGPAWVPLGWTPLKTKLGQICLRLTGNLPLGVWRCVTKTTGGYKLLVWWIGLCYPSYRGQGQHPMGSYLNAWSNLDETHRGGGPWIGVGPLWVTQLPLGCLQTILSPGQTPQGGCLNAWSVLNEIHRSLVRGRSPVSFEYIGPGSVFRGSWASGARAVSWPGWCLIPDWWLWDVKFCTFYSCLHCSMG